MITEAYVADTLFAIGCTCQHKDGERRVRIDATELSVCYQFDAFLGCVQRRLRSILINHFHLPLFPFPHIPVLSIAGIPRSHEDVHLRRGFRSRFNPRHRLGSTGRRKTTAACSSCLRRRSSPHPQCHRSSR